MKKIILIFVLFLGFSNTLSAASVWEKYNLQKLQKQQRPLGKITALQGDVRIQKIGREEIEDAKVGDVIHRGDIITQFAGNSTITLNSGATAQLKGESQVFVDNDGFHLEHGNADFNSKEKTEKIDAGYAGLTTKNSNLKVYRSKNGIMGEYFAQPDSVEVAKGNVTVRVPKGVDKFDIFYQDSEKEIQADRFLLKKDETALFDGKNVTIVGKNKRKPPLERDDRKRYFIGAELTLAYLSRTLENASISTEQKLIFRPGVNFLIMKRRIDPMFAITYTTDPEMDEFKFEYIRPRRDLYAEGFFKSTPYYKIGVGFGNTHGEDLTPTHSAIALGYGWLKKMGDYITFVDLNLKKREWEFDRGGDEGARNQIWSETEFAIETKIIHRFRW